jgi:hypothetical protein
MDLHDEISDTFKIKIHIYHYHPATRYLYVPPSHAQLPEHRFHLACSNATTYTSDQAATETPYPPSRNQRVLLLNHNHQEYQDSNLSSMKSRFAQRTCRVGTKCACHGGDAFSTSAPVMSRHSSSWFRWCIAMASPNRFSA